MEPQQAVEEPDHWRPDPHADLTGWLVAAGLFWIEACGLIGIGLAALGAPFSCYGDPAPGSPGPCDDGVPFYRDQVAFTWLIGLGIIAAIVLVAWIVTARDPRARGVAFLAIGAAVVGVILWSVVGSPVPFLIALIWLGVPALLFLRCANRLLQRAGSEPSLREPR